MITLTKSYSDDTKLQKKINVKKIVSLKEFMNKPIEELKLKFNNTQEINKIYAAAKRWIFFSKDYKFKKICIKY